MKSEGKYFQLKTQSDHFYNVEVTHIW
jgi:hypothetical protein